MLFGGDDDSINAVEGDNDGHARISLLFFISG